MVPQTHRCRVRLESVTFSTRPSQTLRSPGPAWSSDPAHSRQMVRRVSPLKPILPGTALLAPGLSICLNPAFLSVTLASFQTARFFYHFLSPVPRAFLPCRSPRHSAPATPRPAVCCPNSSRAPSETASVFSTLSDSSRVLPLPVADPRLTWRMLLLSRRTNLGVSRWDRCPGEQGWFNIRKSM